MSGQHPQAHPGLGLPHPDRVVRGAADNGAPVVLKAGNTALVALNRPQTLPCEDIPDLDGAVSRGGNQVILMDLYGVDRSRVLVHHAELGEILQVPNSYPENKNLKCYKKKMMKKKKVLTFCLSSTK